MSDSFLAAAATRVFDLTAYGFMEEWDAALVEVYKNPPQPEPEPEPEPSGNLEEQFLTKPPEERPIQTIEINSLHEAKGRQSMLNALIKDGCFIFKPFSPPASSELFDHVYGAFHKYNCQETEWKKKGAPTPGGPPHGYVSNADMELYAAKIHLKQGYDYPDLKVPVKEGGKGRPQFGGAVDECQKMLGSTCRTALASIWTEMDLHGRARSNLRSIVDLETCGFEYA